MTFSDSPTNLHSQWRRGFLSLILLALFGFVASSAQAQREPTQVEGVVISGRIPLGESTAFVLRVINGKPDSLPEQIPAEGLEIVRTSGHNHKQTSVNGVFQSEYQFYYQVTGKQAGEFRIPEVSVAIDGKTYTTLPLEVVVYERDPSDPSLDASRPYFANLTTPMKEVFAGQMVPFDLDVYVRGARSINDMGPPILRHESLVIEFDGNYQLDIVELDGIQFTTAQRPGYLFGLTPGSYTVGPAEVKVAMIDERSGFGRMPGFFQSFVAKNLQTNPMELVVKPLPVDGRPINFAGAVGDFEMSVTASPKSLTVGDPISLEFEVTGPGNFDILQAPEFLVENASEWRTYDARKMVDSSENSDGIQSGRATFTQVVMPQVEAREIPPFELAFFNPQTRSYETVRTSPIPITVSPDTQAGTSSANGIAIPSAGEQAAASSHAVPIEAAATPEPKFNDIVHSPTTNPDWRPVPATITSRPAFWIGQLIPSLAFIGLLGLGLTRKLRARKPKDTRGNAISFTTARAQVAAASSRVAHYRAILVALDSWAREAGPLGEKALPEKLGAAYQALRSRAQWLVYGTGSDEQDQSLSANEKTECANILDALGEELK